MIGIVTAADAGSTFGYDNPFCFARHGLLITVCIH